MESADNYATARYRVWRVPVTAELKKQNELNKIVLFNRLVR